MNCFSYFVALMTKTASKSSIDGWPWRYSFVVSGNHSFHLLLEKGNTQSYNKLKVSMYKMV